MALASAPAIAGTRAEWVRPRSRIGWAGSRRLGDRVQRVRAARGCLHTFRRSGTRWLHSDTFAPTGTGPGTRAGGSLDVEGNTLVVGSTFYGANFEGAAHVFVRTEDGWEEQQQLVPIPEEVCSSYGSSVAIQGDTIIVCAAEECFKRPGGAHIFSRQGSTWIQTAVVESPSHPGNSLGTSVDLDGDALVVGAPFDSISGPAGGAAYVFRRSTGTFAWDLEAFLFVNEPTNGRKLGSVVAVDGERIALSAPQTGPGNFGSGEAYVFVHEGDFWRQSAKLEANPAPPGAGLGWSLALDGSDLLVGMNADDLQGQSSGSIVLFELERASVAYSSGKPNSLGCVPFLTTAASASASSANPFPVAMQDALPGEAGVLFYGFGSAQLGFHGGTLCVKAPLVRWLPAVSAKTSGAPPCTGVLERDFNVRVQSGADRRLTTGQRVYAQWLQRDSADPAAFGDSLSDAVTFLIGS